MYPPRAPMPHNTAIPPHKPNTYVFDIPAFFMPTALDMPSGTLAKKTAATIGNDTPPSSTLSPMTMDSGTPSSTDPSAMASAATPAVLFSGKTERLRLRAPFSASTTAPTVNIAAPTTKPMVVANRPPACQASPISSNATADMRMPEPKAIMPAVTRGDGLENHPTDAPTSEAPPQKSPHANATNPSI